MAVFGKIVTLLRGSVRELGETLVDGNTVRIYEQEIADAKHDIAQARTDLTAVMAKEMQSAREIERLKAELTRLEGLALEALQKNESALAEGVAGRAGEIEAELDEQVKAHATYAVQVCKMKDLIKTAEAKIREHEREAAMARTAESVYRATLSVSNALGARGSTLPSAKESLARIKRRHEDLADRIAAADQLDRELGSAVLDIRLAAAGIGVSDDRARSVMERIRARAAERGEAPKGS